MYSRLLTALAGVLICASYAAAYPFAYITNPSDNTVSVIDTNNNNYVAKVPLGTGKGPSGVAVNANGTRLYVSNKTEKSISVLDIITDVNNPTVVNTINGLTNIPSGIAINPAGTRLYVANNDGASVTVLDISALTPNTTVSAATVTLASPTVGNNPVGVAIHPDGTYVYVANSGSNSVSVIDTSTNTVSGVAITVGTSPMGIAVGKVGTAVKVFVANSGSDTVSIIDAVTRVVTPVSLGITGANPYSVTVAPDGSKAYVTNTFADSVSVIDTSNNSVTTPYQLTAFSSPMGISITPDGSRIYTVNQTGAPGDGQSYGTLSSILVLVDPVGAITNLPNNLGNPSFFNSPETLGNFIGPQLYTVTATAGANGTVASADGKITSSAVPTITQIVAPGSRPVYTIAPAVNYRIDSIKINGNIISQGTDPNFNSTASTYTFSPVNADPSIVVSFIKDYYYVSVVRPADTVTANGSITSSPAGINCSSATSPSLCQASFQVNTTVVLTATPNAGKYFVKWVGDRDEKGNLINNGALCDGQTTTDAQGRGICTFTMTDYTNFTAQFSDTPTGDLVRMQPQGTFYHTVQAAFDAATTTTSEIQLTAIQDMVEGPNFNKSGVTVTLTGGWTAITFPSRGTAPTNVSTGTGAFTITQGTVIFDNVVIK
jgi:YVTN family beta-propeller protein